MTYKPAPQLTVDNLSAQMQDTANADPSNDTHNDCRTAMWYDINGEHVSRAKALFCCNAAPKAAYIAANAATGLQALSADWQRNGIVDTTTAAGTNTAGTSLPVGTSVAMTGNWMDSNTVANVHGAFQGFNSSLPEPPLMRATGMAVTLISHGGNGDLAFLPEQAKTSLSGGGRVNPGAGGGIAGANNVATETDNVWPLTHCARSRGLFGTRQSEYSSFAMPDFCFDQLPV
jgi:hypothetical protein